jgi:vacuolar-type H+-ATPase subunit I/STV1
MTKENEGVGDTGVNESASGDSQTKKDHVSYETYQKLLSQRKKDQERLTALEKEQQELLEKKKQDEENKLNEKGEYKKIIEIREQKINELTGKINEFENKYKSIEDQLKTRRKLEAFLGKLPARLMDHDYLKLVDFDDIAVDPETGDVDGNSLDTVVSSFVKKHGRLLETKKTGMPNEATTGSSKIDYDSWLKLPFKEQKKYKWEDLKNIPK